MLVKKVVNGFLVVIFSLCLPVAGLLAAEEEGVPFVRIFSDEAGESHFEDGFLPVDFIQLQSGEMAGIHQLAIENQASILILEPGAFEDFHQAPAAQMLIVIQGIAEVGATDGELRQLTPGMVFMMEDYEGRGHTTRTVGTENHIGIMIPLLQD